GPGNQFTFATTGSGTASTAAGGSPGSGSPGSGSPGGGSPGGSGAAPSSGSGGSAPGSGGSAPGGAGAPASGSPPSSTSRVSRAVGRASVVPRTFSHRSGPGGSVLVRIDLSCPAGRRCDGTARLVLERSPGSAGRWRPEVLGSCTFSVAPAHRGAVGFTVPAAEARLLARSTGGELVLDLRSGRLVTSLVLGAA
ncbi:MAG TPA: hypothetical protein VMD59_18740, partial [Acidimicrobiales bacterium]|nr:hypothetical protein [Acidimicrobiales bacterium]